MITLGLTVYIRVIGFYLLYIFFVFLLSIQNTYAWPPTFGPEFTFTSDSLLDEAAKSKSIENNVSKKLLQEWKTKIEIECKLSKKCFVNETTDKHGRAYKVKYRDGFYYTVGLDNGVLEVVTEPLTIKAFKAQSDTINKNIFDLAKSLGMYPHERRGGGHLNIGLDSAFGNDATLFRNFIVDMANHPELNQGILGEHLGNAPTIAQLKPESHIALKRIISEFDEKPTDIFDLVKRIEREVYTNNPYNWYPFYYYQNIRMDSIKRLFNPKARRVEIRGVRPQKSFEHFLKECELFEKRLSFLKKLKVPLALNIPKLNTFEAEKGARFNAYLSEMNESPDRYHLLYSETSEIRCVDGFKLIH